MLKTVYIFIAICFFNQIGFGQPATNPNQQKVDSLLGVMQKMSDDSSKVKIFTAIGRIKENEDLDSAKWYYRQGLVVSEKIKYTEGVLAYYENYTYLLDVEGKNDTSLLLKQEALRIALKLGNQTWIGNAYANIGNSFFNQTQFDSSLKYNQIALPYIEKANDINKEILFKANIGLIYDKLKQYDKAKEYLEWSVSMARKHNQEYSLMTSLNQLAIVFSGQKKYVQSENANLEALGLAKKLNNLQYLGFCYLLQAELKRIQKNVPALKENLLNAIDVSNKLGYIGNICEAKIGLGLAYIYEKNLMQAQKITLESYNLAVENKLDEYAKKASFQLLSISMALGNISEINKYNDIHDSIEQKINKEQQAKTIQELETKFETEKKDNQIKLQVSEIKNKKNWNYFLAIGIASLALLSFIGYRNYRNKQKVQQLKITELETEKQLAATEAVLKGEEQERTRLAKDLHDGLGGMLSGIKYSFNNMKENLILTPDTAQAFSRSMDMLDNSIQEMRRVAHNMMPEPLLRYGLHKTLQDYVTDVNKNGVTKIVYQGLNIETLQLDNSTAVTIYRIVQELINNTLKHAAAKNMLVQLLASPNGLVLNVEDDGNGFDTKIIDLSNGGIGWKNIKSRVDLLKGTLKVESSIGSGTQVNIELTV